MIIRKANKFLMIFFSLCFLACSNYVWYSEFKDFKNGWPLSAPAIFSYSATSDFKGNIYISIRNDNYYPFSNIFLIASLLENGIEISNDTLEYKMADKSGKFLGKGFGSVKESLLFWKENITLTSNSKYSVVIKHAMRKNDSEFGMKTLPGIISVGINMIDNNQNE